ncbi:uncharacterized protein LOC118407821 [Branchiostoma floridae]|uniref:Uncharacterized protein LOC118407821 n=1 Tax=Branchiostoma floridae TaxID=7739 RepID=A0A9J7HRM1_BRAFL|nr:uncharacterized protein LOC118407821 [Branchiostoma floridae]
MKVLFVNVLFVFAFLTVPLVLGIYIPPEEKILSCAARQKAGTDPFPLHCADDGTFKPRQCDVTAGLCYCAHPERGTIYSETAVPAGQAHAQGPDCDKYWREHDAPDDDAVPMLLMLPVDPPVAITALSNDIEQPAADSNDIEQYRNTVYDDEDIDLCDFAQCEAHSRCVAPPGAQVPLCRCDAGYGSVGGAACTSRCELEPGFCRNDGRCDVQPELGVICRCRAGASWWHAGLRCETYMSYFMVFSIGGGAVGGVFVIMLLCLILVAKKVPNKTRPHSYYPSPYRRPFFMEAPAPGVSGPAETTWKENPMFIDEQEEDIYSTISRKAGQEISRELRELEASDIEDPYGIIGMFTKAESISTSGAKLPPGDWNGVVRFKPTVECIDPNWKFKIKRPRYAFNPEYEQQRDDLSWP